MPLRTRHNWINTTFYRSVASLATVLIICLLTSADQVTSQMQSLELDELIEKIALGTLPEVTTEIKQRGVNFAFTNAVRRRVEDAVIKYHKDTKQAKTPSNTVVKDDYEELTSAISEHEPSELLVALAEFRSGNDNDIVNLQTAIERRLKELGAPKNLIRFRPLLVSKERSSAISTDNDAYKAGDELGVNLVIWGRWERPDPRGPAILRPRVRVVHSHKAIGLWEGQGRQGEYKLEPLVHGDVINIIESGAKTTANLIEILIAISFYERRDYTQASRILGNIETRDSDVFFYLGNCSFINDKFEQAEHFYSEALQLNGTSLKAIHNLATSQYRAGKLSQAVSSFERALNIDPTSDKTLNNLGSLLVEMDRFDEGLRYIELAFEKNPKNAFARYNYAAALYNRGRNKQALEAFTEYLKLPEYMSLRPEEDHRVLSLCAELLQRYFPEKGEQVRSFLLKAIRYGPTEGSYLVSYLRYIPLRSDHEALEEELNLHQQWLASLTKAHFNDTYVNSRVKEDTRKALLARITYLFVKLGALKEANKTFREIGIRNEELGDCQSRLVHHLISGDIVTTPFRRPDLTKTYYETMYAHFFTRNSFGSLLVAMNRAALLDSYSLLLRTEPKHLGCLIGKGILLLEILKFDKDDVINRRTKRPRDDNADTWIKFANEALITLQKAYTRAGPMLKSDLKECLDTLTRL